METETPFTDPSLSLRSLSEKTGIPIRYLSEILNQRLNQSFSDFVNQYRVEEVKRKLQDGEDAKYTVLSIAYEAGFNSKSAFNAAFKKHMRMTPSQYRDSLK